jgi:hypothetical protein
MEVNAILADSVVVSEGKLFVQGGGWNVLNTPRLPTRHPRIGLGLVISVPFTATDRDHAFAIRLEDADGRPVGAAGAEGHQGNANGTFRVGRSPHLADGDEELVALALSFDGLTFADAGRYRFVLTIDGDEQRHLPFTVRYTGGAHGS